MAHDVNQSERDVAVQVRSALVARIGRERFELWLPADCQWNWVDGKLALIFSTEFICQIAKRMLYDDLRAALNEAVGPSALLTLEVGKSTATATADLPAVEALVIGLPDCTVKSELTTAVSFKAETIPMARSLEAKPADRAKADAWAEFVPGSSSQFAWTTINMVVDEPGRMTPVFVHGPYGVGKSHLAMALAQRLRAQRRQRRVLHITAEQFTNDFTEAFRGSGLPMLRRKYRDVDTLILDDVQFLIGKKATVNELRHTVDNLLKAGKQIVLVSDRTLQELEPLGSDFIARLRGGLVSPMLPLDEATRFQILKRDLLAEEVSVSDDIVMQIAARAIGDGRLLKGIAKRLIATAYIESTKLTWDRCWGAIHDLVRSTQPIVRLGDIERVVCEVFGLEPNSLQSDRKTRSVSQPRMLAMFLARKYTPAAYQEIGEFFGNRRHSTVISAQKTVTVWLEGNEKLQLPRGSLGVRDALRHVEANLHVG